MFTRVLQKHLAMEALESRRHLSGIPYHLQLAEDMVNNISPANNVYSYDTPVVKFAGLHGATQYYNSSDCSTFVTALLTQAYGYTSADFTKWTGYSSPQAEDYYDAALDDHGFKGFTNIANVVPGDELFIKFLDNSSDTGHCATVMAAPTLISVSASQETYDLTVLDCTEDPHSSDTRTGSETGVGEGVMQIFTNLSGNMTAYAWSTDPDSVVETSATRPAIFATLPVVPEPDTIEVFGAVGSLVILGRWRERARRKVRGEQARGLNESQPMTITDKKLSKNKCGVP